MKKRTREKKKLRNWVLLLSLFDNLYLNSHMWWREYISDLGCFISKRKTRTAHLQVPLHPSQLPSISMATSLQEGAWYLCWCGWLKITETFKLQATGSKCYNSQLCRKTWFFFFQEKPEVRERTRTEERWYHDHMEKWKCLTSLLVSCYRSRSTFQNCRAKNYAFQDVQSLSPTSC